MDFGVHVIDLYHYLLQPEWTLISAVHDGFCGPEGLAEIELQANGAPVSIRLSRYHDQENVAHLMFERAEVSFNVHDGTEYCKQSNAGTLTRVSIPSGGAQYGSHAESLLLNFLAASEKRELAVCDASSSMPVIEILDEIYCRAEQYPVNLGYV